MPAINSSNGMFADRAASPSDSAPPQQVSMPNLLSTGRAEGYQTISAFTVREALSSGRVGLALHVVMNVSSGVNAWVSAFGRSPRMNES